MRVRYAGYDAELAGKTEDNAGRVWLVLDFDRAPEGLHHAFSGVLLLIPAAEALPRLERATPVRVAQLASFDWDATRAFQLRREIGQAPGRFPKELPPMSRDDLREVQLMDARTRAKARQRAKAKQ